MKKQLIKKVAAGLLMAVSLSLGIGIFSTPEAQAQSRDRYWGRDRYDRRDRDWERRRQIERARAIERARQRERERCEGYRYGSSRNYPYYGNSGRYGGYGYGGRNHEEEQRGYRNGLKEGQDDARDHDSFNPSRHSSFRDGNPSYRAGFARGYEQAYRQYSYGRRW